MNINCVVFDSTITNGNTTMDTKALRQKILDLAIRGKLVPQDPNDEPASVLLERIKAEKEWLIKEGKIKRSKKAAKTSDTPHYGNVLPKGWCLTDIGELLINRDGERKPVSSAIRNKQTNKIYDYYGAAGVIDKVNSYLFDERLLLIGEDGANLLSRSKNNAFFAEGKYWVNNHAHVLDATNKKILDFVAIAINSMKLDDYITGSAQPKLSQDNLNKIPITLPPLAEQQRIIAEIKKWFTIIETIESGKENLNTIIKQIKNKILDIAIHGKLVPQDPNDEPAIELLKRINPDFTPCDNGHYPLNVPSGWIWTTLKDSISLKSGIHIKVRDNTSGIYPIYGGNGVNGSFNEYNVERNTIIIGRVGFYCGSVHLTDSKSWITDNALIVTKNELYDTSYLVYLLKYLDLGKTSNSTAQPVVSGKGILPLQVPLPPLAEQQRIVAKIEEIFSILDGIQNSLEV